MQLKLNCRELHAHARPFVLILNSWTRFCQHIKSIWRKQTPPWLIMVVWKGCHKSSMMAGFRCHHRQLCFSGEGRAGETEKEQTELSRAVPSCLNSFPFVFLLSPFLTYSWQPSSHPTPTHTFTLHLSLFFLPWPLCNSFSSPTSSISVVAPPWDPLKLNTSKSRENTKIISWHFSVPAYYLTSTLFLWSFHSKVAFFRSVYIPPLGLISNVTPKTGATPFP